MFPTLKTDRLLLRQFRPEDIDNVFYALSHPDVIPYYGISFRTLEETQVQMDWFAELERAGTGIWWAICSPDDATFYGACGLYYIQPQHRKGETGFWLLPEHWGRGIMREALPVMLDYGFQQLQLHRIEAFVESENQNSKRILEKLDFAYEGTMRECEIKNGRFISLAIYARFRQLF